jgi:hypothetical protein
MHQRLEDERLRNERCLTRLHSGSICKILHTNKPQKINLW